ncbi:GntR family transcriptional regulator [Streptomyces scopuliridis]
MPCSSDRPRPEWPRRWRRAAARADAAALTADIEAGRIKPGERIPSESELCERHGVARETVRRAVRVLRERGVVETEWGKGTFVRDRSEPAGETGT